MQTTLVVVGVLVVSFIVMYYLAKARMKNIPLVESNDKILILTDKNFKNQLKNKTVLVDFWAEWCAPCRMMAPVLNEVAEELTGEAKVAKIDIEKYQSMAQMYKVRNIPTLILFKNGEEVNRFVGVKNKSFLIQQINNIA